MINKHTIFTTYKVLLRSNQTITALQALELLKMPTVIVFEAKQNAFID